MTAQSQSINSIQTTNDGLDINGGDTWTIDPEIFVTSQTQIGVNNNGSGDSTLINNGFIISLALNQWGVTLYGGSEIVVNEASGEIISAGTSSFSAGVDLRGSNGDHLDNLGYIWGARSGVHYEQTAAGGIGGFNNGTIFGTSAGIFNESFTDGGNFTNAGSITSDNFGIEYFDPVQTHTISITNLVGGFISGGSRAIFTTGILSLTNSGLISGDVLVNSPGASSIVNKGKGSITGQIFLNGGGNDTVVADKTGVHVHVGTGKDSITLAGGHDQIFFDSAFAGQFDTIKHFTHGKDTIVLSETDFANLGALGHLDKKHFDIGHATHSHPEIVYNPGNGAIFYDANGKAPGGLNHFATLLDHPATISQADFFLIA
jgi:hypothetical protein